MTVGSISGTGTQTVQSTMGQQAGDALSKSLQKQIADTKQKLQDVSSNQELSMEEKMQKRQELQKQVFDLQNQLRQHEMELRREAKQEKSSEMEELLGGSRETAATDEEGTAQIPGVNQAGMEAMISADSALTQAKTQGSVARKMKGSAKILEGEIKMDAGRGKSVEAKQAALSDIEQKAMQATASQVQGLREASEKLSDAVSPEQVTNTGRSDTEEPEKAEPKDIYAQYNDTVTVEISGAGLAALAESKGNVSS